MAADYPSSITTLYSDVVSGQIIDITHINRLKEEIVAIETELGTSPSGSYSDVKTKLNEIDLENRLALTDFASDDLVSVYDTSASDNKKITVDNLIGASIYISNEQSDGTDGGVATAGAWTKLTLNTLSDPSSFNFASLTSSVITLEAGKYMIDGFQMFYRVEFGRSRLIATAASTTAVVSNSGYYKASSEVQAPSILKGTIDLSTATALELQYDCSSTTGGNGLGNAVTSGEVELHARLKITKIG